MHTDLQSAILAALRIRHPEAMTDVDVWAATGGYEYGGHSLSCVIACFELEKQGRIQSVEDGKKWKLTDTEDAQSSQGNVGQVAGADRKPSPPKDAPSREVAESSQSGHGFAPSPANSGETGSCGDNLHAFQPHAEHAVSLPTPARELPDTPMCTAPAGLDIHISAEAATDGDQHTCSGSTPSRAKTLCAGESCGLYDERCSDSNHEGQSPVTAIDANCGTSCVKSAGDEGESSQSCSCLARLSEITNRPQDYCFDVPQSSARVAAESMSCGERAATGKDGSRTASRKADGTLGNETRQDCGSDEVESLIPQVSSIRDGVEGDDRAAGLDLLSPEFHAVHIADEGANSTRAWWGELERDAQEAIAGELVSNERWR